MGPVPPHPAPWVFSPPGRCKAGAGGESSLRVICTSKAAFASHPPSPCVRKVARFNCSFKGSSGPGPAEIFGTDSAPPHTLLPMARNWCGGTGVLREDANQLSSVSELICIR